MGSVSIAFTWRNVGQPINVCGTELWRSMIAAWRNDSKHHRPHKSLDGSSTEIVLPVVQTALN